MENIFTVLQGLTKLEVTGWTVRVFVQPYGFVHSVEWGEAGCSVAYSPSPALNEPLSLCKYAEAAARCAWEAGTVYSKGQFTARAWVDVPHATEKSLHMLIEPQCPALREAWVLAYR